MINGNYLLILLMVIKLMD